MYAVGNGVGDALRTHLKLSAVVLGSAHSLWSATTLCRTRCSHRRSCLPRGQVLHLDSQCETSSAIQLHILGLHLATLLHHLARTDLLRPARCVRLSLVALSLSPLHSRLALFTLIRPLYAHTAPPIFSPPLRPLFQLGRRGAPAQDAANALPPGPRRSPQSRTRQRSSSAIHQSQSDQLEASSWTAG